MSLDAMILGRDMNGEGVASLLNMAKLTLSHAASAPTEAVRFQEFDAAVDALQAQVATLAGNQSSISQVHVDASSTTLAAALALGTYNESTDSWTFGSKVINEGDVIVLQSPINISDRTWIHNGGVSGTVNDFTHLNSDISALIDAGVVTVLNAIRDGVPEAGDTLKKVFSFAQTLQSQLIALESRVTATEEGVSTLNTALATKADFAQVSITFTDANADGIIEASVANPIGSYKAIVFVLKEGVGGVYSMVEGDAYDLKISNETLAFRTLSPSMLGQTYKVIVIGL